MFSTAKNKTKKQNIMNLLKQKEAEINEQLGKINDAFLASKWSDQQYDGKPVVALPEWFKEDFKKIILHQPPKDNQILSHQLLAISQTALEDLAFGQVGLMFSVFNNVAPIAFETDFDKYIQKRRDVDKIMITFNHLHEEKTQELMESKRFQMSMYTKDGIKKSGSQFIN